jgi:cytochrome c oxidase subunit 4
MARRVVPQKVYLNVLIALMALLAMTVTASFVDFDRLVGRGANTAIALSIAVAKGLLIILFFMHLRYGSKLTWVFAAAGFVWLSILLSLTLTDYLTRNHPAEANFHGEPRFLVSHVK